MPNAPAAADWDRWPDRLAALVDAAGAEPSDDALRQAADLGRALAQAGVAVTDVVTAPWSLLEQRLRQNGGPADAVLRPLERLVRRLMEEYAAVTEEAAARRAARWQAIEGLHRENDRAQAYLDIAGVIIVALDVRGTVTLVNKKACAILGYGEQDLVGQPWFGRFVPESDRERVKCTFDALIAGDKPPLEYHENPVLTRAGEERLISWHNALLRDAAGRVVGTLSSGEDITDRRQAERELQRYQEHLEELVAQRTRELTEVNARLEEESAFTRHVVTGVPAIICRVAPDGTALFVNSAGERIGGYRAEELVGRNWWRVFYPGDEYHQVERLLEAFQRGAVRDYDMVLTTKAGAKRTISWNSVNRFGPDGRVLEIIGFGDDVTERRQANRALRESEERFRQLAENMTGFFWLYERATGKLLYVGPGYEQIWGRSCESVYADPDSWLALIHPDDRPWVNEAWKRQRCGEFTEQVYRVVRADGTTRWVRTRSFPIRDTAESARRIAVIGEDVTEQREAERELRVFKTVSDRAGYGSAIVDLEGRITYVNEAFATMHGRTTTELLGQPLSIFHSAAQLPRVDALNERLRQGGRFIGEEVWHVRADGSEFPSLMTGILLGDEQGRPEFMAATAIDITDRKRAEVALRESKEFLDKIINSIGDPIFVKDREHRMVLVNDAECALTGYPRAQVLGKTDYEFFSQAQVDVFWEKDAAVLETGVENINEEEITDAQGATRTIVTKKTRYMDPAGNQFLVGVIRDITDRKRMEEALRASEAKFRTLAETIPVAIEITRGPRVLYVNSAAELITGYSHAELMALDYWDLLHPDFRDRVRAWGEARERGERVPSRYEAQFLSKAGEPRWGDISASLFTFEGQPAVLATGIDITDRRRAEEALRQHQEQLAHVARVSTVGEMASGLAHELSQPLTAILYFARGCSRRLQAGTRDTAETLDTLQKIAVQAERAGEFVRRLKAFVRKAVPQRVPADLNVIVHEALSFAAADVRSKHVTVRLDLAEDLPQVQVDPLQIEQVLLNLVRNAIDAMEATPTDERELWIRTHVGPHGTICVGIRDTGAGLTPEVAEQVFDPFFTTKPAGTGLGLSISRTIIEDAHGGELWVKPDPRGGAAAGFALPARKGGAYAGE